MSDAVVIGGGVVGLTAARVLADQFDSVTLIEKDPHLGVFEARSGVPQGRHLHVLLARGLRILEKWFPGIGDELKAEGCPSVDWARDTLWENRFGAFPRYESKIETISVSRPLLEAKIFARVKDLQNLSIVSGEILGIEADADSIVRFRSANREWEADYGVLAAGQNASARVVGNFISSEKKYPIQLTYRTALLRLRDGALQGCKQRYYQLDPVRENNGGVIIPIERGMHLMTLVEYGSTPRRSFSHDEFRSLANQIPNGAMSDCLKNAEFVGDISVFHKKNMYLRKFKDNLRNLEILGDSKTSLNPVFGQGMTLGLMQVDRLAEKKALRRHSRIEKVSYLAGSVASMRKPTAMKYGFDSCLRLCQSSRRLHRRFLRELHLL